MARKAKLPERLVGWHRLQESAGNGKHRRTWDMTIDMQYGGMSFTDLYAELEAIKTDYGKEFSHFKLETDTISRAYEDGTDIVTYVYGWREETNEEFDERLAQAASKVADNEERDRKEFERLAKKFKQKT